jgi:hypothetical protein
VIFTNELEQAQKAWRERPNGAFSRCSRGFLQLLRGTCTSASVKSCGHIVAWGVGIEIGTGLWDEGTSQIGWGRQGHFTALMQSWRALQTTVRGPIDRSYLSTAPCLRKNQPNGKAMSIQTHLTKLELPFTQPEKGCGTVSKC